MDEGGQANLILFTSGMFAYSDWKIPRVDVQKLSEKDLLENVQPEKVSEIKSEVKDTTEPNQIVEEQNKEGQNDPW